MKRSILAVFSAAAVAAAVSSCNQKKADPVLVSSTVEITLGNPATKAFGDGSTEAFEKGVSSITVFVYENNNETCILQRTFTEFEIEQGKAVFAIPDVKAQTLYDFFAIANCNLSGLGEKPTRTSLLAETEGTGASSSTYGSLSDYNGTFNSVTTSALRNVNGQTGFIMSGMATAMTPAAGSNIPTKVTVPLRRTVAKVAIDMKVTTTFQDKYTSRSTLKITNAQLKQLVKSTSLIVPESEPSTLGTVDGELTQSPFVVTENKQYQNLFYIYANGVEQHPSAESERPILVLTALFDFDGDGSTTEDQSTITYNIKLSGEAGNETDPSDNDFGLFIRNGNYKVNIDINGLTENEVVAEIEIKDWETVKQQDITIGDKN